MPRKTISITSEFEQAVEDYRLKENLPSWSAAIIQLAKIALEWEGVARNQWGGKREEAVEIVRFLSSMKPEQEQAWLEANEG